MLADSLKQKFGSCFIHILLAYRRLLSLNIVVVEHWQSYSVLMVKLREPWVFQYLRSAQSLSWLLAQNALHKVDKRF